MVWQRLATQRQEFGLQPYHVTAMQTLRSEGHTVGKMLAVAYAESFHAGPGIGLVLAVKGRPRVATATTTPFFDPQDMRLRA